MHIIKICFLLAITILTACSSNEGLHPEGSMDTAGTRQAEKRYSAIHKLIYDNPSEARSMAEKILDTANPDQVSRIVLLKHIGSSYVFETNYPEAMKYYNRALDMATAISLYPQVANINNNLGVIYNEIGNYRMAYMHLMQALSNYELSGETAKKPAAWNNIGIIFMNMKNYDKALTYYRKALAPENRITDTILQVSILNNIALCHNSIQNQDSAFFNLQQAIRLATEVNNKYGLCISHQLMGSVNLSLNQTQQALSSYKASLAIAHHNNLPYQLAQARIGISRALLQQGKVTEALTEANQVIRMAESQNSLVLVSDAHELLSAIYEKSGDYNKALSHFQQHVRTQQEVVNQTVVHQIYDVELNSLNQLNQMQKLEIEKKELAISKKNNIIFFVSLLSVLLLTGLYLLYINHHHRQEVKFQKTVVELTEKKSNAALEAEIQERKRIGQELHDSLGHLLSVAGLNASVLQSRTDLSDEKRAAIIGSLTKTIDDAFDEVRNISHNLAPSLLSERGLKGALKSISDRINQNTGLSMTYDTFGLSGKLDPIIENTLYRTIQEIVNNTIKHAQASKLFIQITQGQNEVSLMAEDNGLGFNYQEMQQAPNHHGLRQMRSRIENLNGTLYIDSNPKRGTIISILIPFSEPKNNPAVKATSVNTL